jgi:hypothetical protein
MKAEIGHFLDSNENHNRDAIHVPIMPVVASEELSPGEKIVVKPMGNYFVASKVTGKAKAVGVVDPYLPRNAQAGEKFYAWVKPATVHKLWHEWSHPLFDK